MACCYMVVIFVHIAHAYTVALLIVSEHGRQPALPVDGNSVATKVCAFAERRQPFHFGEEIAMKVSLAHKNLVEAYEKGRHCRVTLCIQ